MASNRKTVIHRSGSRDDFERLAYGLLRPVYNAAARLSGNTEDGLDMARETFVRAYGRYSSTPPDGSFRLWLYGVLLEVHNERQHIGEEAPAWLEAMDEAVAIAGLSAPRGAGVTFAQRPEMSAIDRAINSLPDDLRTAFVLSDLEDFSYDQIGLILHRSRSVVAGRIYTARRMLRAALRKQPPERPTIEMQ